MLERRGAPSALLTSKLLLRLLLGDSFDQSLPLWNARSGTPARLLWALLQNEVNSYGCRYPCPYTKRPTGRCVSTILL